MAEEGQKIGTARIDVVVDTTRMDAAVDAAKTRISGMSTQAQADYAQLSASQKRAADSALKQAEAIGRSREEMILYRASLKGLPLSILDELKTKLSEAGAAQAEVAAATNAFGETEAQAAARLKAVATQAVSTNAVIAESETSVAERMGLRTEATAAQWAATKAAVQSDRARIASEIEAIAVTDADTTSLEANTAANVENAAATKLNSKVTYELSTLLGEAASGNFSRMKRSAAALANQTGILSKAFGFLVSPVGIATIALAGMGAAAYIQQERIDKLKNSLRATGDAAGVTASQLEEWSVQVGESSTTIGDAQDVYAQLAGSGKLVGEELHKAGQLAIDFAAVTGASAKDAATAIERMVTDPQNEIAKLDDQYHFLTDAVRSQINAMLDNGQVAEAASLALDKFKDHEHAVALQVQQDLPWYHKLWNAVANATDNAGTDIAVALGGGTLQQKIKDAMHLRDTTQFADVRASAQDEINALQAQLDEQAKKAQAAAIHFIEPISGYGKKALALDEANLKKQEAVQQLSYADRIAYEQKFWKHMLDTATKGSAEYVAAYEHLQGFGKKVPKTAAAGIDLAKLRASEASYKSLLNQVNDDFTNAQRQLSAEHAAGLVSDADYYKKQQDLIWKHEGDQVTAIQAEISALQAHKATGKEKVQIDQQIATLEAEATKAQNDAVAKSNELEAKRRGEILKNAAALRSYKEALDAAETALKRQVNAEIERIGMGAKEYQRQQELNSIYEKGADALKKLALARQRPGANTAIVDKEIAQQKADTERQVKIVEDGYAAMDAAQADWTNGAKQAYQDYIDQASNVAGQTDTLFNDAFKNMEGGIDHFEQTGRFKFSSLTNGIISDLDRIAERIVLSEALQSIFGIFGAGAPVSYSGGGFGVGAYGSGGALAAHAMGDVMAGPGLSAYSNSIVDKPTFFANGGNVMGEAGPEAIMPLSRSPNGKLGVQASNAPTELHVTLKNESGQPLEARQSGKPQVDGSRVMAEFIISTVSTDLARGGRSARAVQGRYGIRPRGVPVGG